MTDAWGLSWGDSWGDSWGEEVGVEAEAEEAAFVLAAKPIDFVISPPYYMHGIQLYRNSLGFADKDQAEPELVEIMDILRLFRTAQGVRL